MMGAVKSFYFCKSEGIATASLINEAGFSVCIYKERAIDINIVSKKNPKMMEY